MTKQNIRITIKSPVDENMWTACLNKVFHMVLSISMPTFCKSRKNLFAGDVKVWQLSQLSAINWHSGITVSFKLD